MAGEGGKLRLIICSSLLKETEAVLSSGGFEDVILSSFSMDCGRPQTAGSESEWEKAARSGKGDAIVVLGGCGMHAGSALPLNCRIVKKDQCAYHFVNSEIVDGEQRTGAYVMTPGWLAEWKDRLERWGFDKKTAREFFGESSTRLVLLDTGVDSSGAQRLKEFSEYLGMPSVRLSVGLDYFQDALRRIVLEWRFARAGASAKAESERMNRRLADQAMAIDLIAGLTHMKTEPEAIGQILVLSETLFAPGSMIYAEIEKNEIRNVRASFSPAPEPAACEPWLALDERSANVLNPDGKIKIRFSYHDRLLGILEMSALAVPERWDEYVEMADSISKVCGLALANARMYQKTLEMATTDSLTGLSTRRQFFSLAQKEFARSRRYGRPMAAIMLDIDFFKRVNDLYGHAAGDAVLQGVAAICRAELRTIDVAGRYGGEEFALVMPETDSDLAFVAAERIRTRIADWIPESMPERITVSIGLAMPDERCQDVSALIVRCDKALYRAKKNGRNCTEVWADA